MKDELVKYELAVLAKKIGFNEPTREYFTKDGLEWESGGCNVLNSKSDNVISRPTQSLLARWFREKHRVHVIPDYIGNDKWVCESFLNMPTMKYVVMPLSLFQTFELAYEAGLLAAGNYIKEKIK